MSPTPNRIVGLLGHRGDLGADLSQLPNRKTGEPDAKQKQRTEGRIESPANSEIEKRHDLGPCKCSENSRGRKRRASNSIADIRAGSDPTGEGCLIVLTPGRYDYGEMRQNPRISALLACHSREPHAWIRTKCIKKRWRISGTAAAQRTEKDRSTGTVSPRIPRPGES